MKTIPRPVPAAFGPETKFALTPQAAAPFRATQDTELELLKRRLLKQILDETVDPEFYAPLRRAAQDATALAWASPYPLLVLPVLFEEKARATRLQAVKQKTIRLSSQKLLSEAA